MLTIRLQRTGKKNQADFRIVLAEKKSPVNKKFTEVLGSYNPRRKVFMAKEDRVKYWIGQHVELSPTVHNLFVVNKLLDAKKVKAFNTPKKPAEPAAPETAAPAAATETPAEATEATAEVEAKVEDVPVQETAAADAVASVVEEKSAEPVVAETPAPAPEPIPETEG